MKATENMWRTPDGDYVPTGHPDAQVLAYAAGDDLPDGVALRDEQSTSKAASRPANKARGKAEDK